MNGGTPHVFENSFVDAKMDRTSLDLYNVTSYTKLLSETHALHFRTRNYGLPVAHSRPVQIPVQSRASFPPEHWLSLVKHQAER